MRTTAAENVVSSLEEAALSDVGAGLLRLSAALSPLRAHYYPLDLSLQSTALLGKPPPCLCSSSAGQMLVKCLLLRALEGKGGF